MKTKITKTLLLSALLLGSAVITKAQWGTGSSLLNSVQTCFLNNGSAVAVNGGSANSGALEINTTYGNIILGPQNGGYCHIMTGMPYFYFNKPLDVNGAISSYANEDLTLQTNNGGAGGTTRMTIKNVSGNSNFLMSGALGSAYYNFISQTGDCGLFWTDANGGAGQNASSGFVLAPWEGCFYGIRIDGSNGNIKIGNQSNLPLFFGNAYAAVLNNGTSYMGFNAVRNVSSANWTINGDGTHNGATVMYGDITGNMRFANIQSLGGGVQTLTDGQIHSALSMTINSNGQVVIGDQTMTTPGPYKLYVTGGILTEQIKVAAEHSAYWSDYVFGEGYKLKSLSEVENYIKENKHLPEVPSAADVKKDGIDLASMDATLLKKVEELTLYVIEQQKEIKELKNRLDTVTK